MDNILSLIGRSTPLFKQDINKQKIKAVVPMHTFGHPVDLDGILNICADWNISLIEDAAEKPTFCFPIDGYWKDIGVKSDYDAANKDFEL